VIVGFAPGARVGSARRTTLAGDMTTDPNTRDNDEPEELREEDVQRSDVLDDRVDEADDFGDTDD
jgi:hypothetical protein